MSDQDLIDKLNISHNDRVLDIGGSLKQHQQIEIDTLVDLYPPEKAPYWPSKLKAKHFKQVDIMREKLPFKDKEFDVALCTHVIEDLQNPFLILDEISRVAKRGVVITPSRGLDMVFSHYNLTDWRTGARRQPGLSHHHWFIENIDSKLILTPKIYPILYTNEFQITKWTGGQEGVYFWENKILFDVFSQVDTHAIINNYRAFMEKNRDKIRTGVVAIYWDNPLIILKEFVKICLKRF